MYIKTAKKILRNHFQLVVHCGNNGEDDIIKAMEEYANQQVKLALTGIVKINK